MEALLTLRRPAEAVVSPDGRSVACSVLTAPCTDPPAGQQARLWIAAPGRPPRQVTHGPGLDALPRWSPDGRTLAFASDRGQPGLMALYVLNAEVGEAVPAGELAGSCEEISWSADGQRLLVLAADPGSDRAGALTATRIESRDAPAPDPEVTRPRQVWRRLYLVELAGGRTIEVGPPGENIWEFDWDGRSVAVAVVSGDPSESSWYDATLVSIDLEQRSVTARYQPRLQLAGPQLSPDGSRVAFVEGVASDRATWPGGTPKCAELVPGVLRPADVTGDFEVSWLCWKDGETLLYHSWEGLRSGCGLLSRSGTATKLWSAPETVGGRGAAPLSADAARTVVASVRESTNEPPEVALLTIGDPGRGWQPVTAFNAALRDLDLARRRRRARPARPAAGPRPGGPAAHGDRARRPGVGLDPPVDQLRPPAAVDRGRLRRPAPQPARQPGLGTGVRGGHPGRHGRRRAQRHPVRGGRAGGRRDGRHGPGGHLRRQPRRLHDRVGYHPDRPVRRGHADGVRV
jgi:dipeptidyl aminopeptidase/acylaminoacyl peptidase